MQAVTVVKSSNAVDNSNLFSDVLVSRWLKFAGVADKSVATYSIAIRQLFKYFRDNEIVNPKREDLENWRDGLIDGGKSAATIQLYLTSAKIFFRWLSMENIYPNVADHLKNRVKISGDHKKDALNAEQSAQLLKAITGDSVKSKRDRAIVALLLTAGLRTIEICRADVGDIRNGFLFVLGKGRSEKTESVKLAAPVQNLIADYLESRGKVDNTDPLFTSTSNRCKSARLDTQTVRKLVKTLLRGIGLDSDKLTAHSLRHTAALQMLLNGAKLEQVQQVLRHRSLNTTMIYNHSIERMKNNAEDLAANAIFSAL